MDSETLPAVVAAAVVAGTLLASGPALGLLEPTTAGAHGLGEGDATVDRIGLGDDVRIERGRFGTGVVYLRVPRLEVGVRSVTGTPRLVYAVAVPELGFERVATERLGDAEEGTVVVRMSDRAFPPERLGADAYAVTLTVRVQSFTTDRVLERRNVTAEVVR